MTRDFFFSWVYVQHVKVHDFNKCVFVVWLLYGCVYVRENRCLSADGLESYQFTEHLSFQFLVCDCQIEQLKQEQSRREAEMQALQTKLDTLTNQNSDCKQHIEVLKESLNAKEQRANTLQTEVSAHESTNTPTHPNIHHDGSDPLRLPGKHLLIHTAGGLATRM